MRYLAEGLTRVLSWSVGRWAREDAEDSTLWRRDVNSLGRSVTMRMPREEGPNAERRVVNGMLPSLRSASETDTGCMLVAPMVKRAIGKFS